MKNADVGQVDDGGSATPVTGGGKVDAAQLPVVGHLMESMPGCCDVIGDEQVSLPGHGVGRRRSSVPLTIGNSLKRD